MKHRMKNVNFQSFSGPYFLKFGLNTKIYLQLRSPYSEKHRTLTLYLFFCTTDFKATANIITLMTYKKDMG